MWASDQQHLPHPQLQAPPSPCDAQVAIVTMRLSPSPLLLSPQSPFCPLVSTPKGMAVSCSSASRSRAGGRWG